MKNLLVRSLTGLIYLIIFCGAILSGPYSFALLFLLINFLALNEFYTITRKLGYRPIRIIGLIAGILIFISAFFSNMPIVPFPVYSLVIPLIVILFVTELYRKEAKPLADIASTVLGLVYISLPLSVFNYLAFFDGQTYTFQVVLGFFILLWINDSFAYISGVLMGKHRLFERISPKKSWEGFIGGTAITIAAAFFMPEFLDMLPSTDWIVIAIIVSGAGVYGDLVESMIKRSADIKDSGKILPGHGGMLDRIDSVLLSVPLVYIYLILF